MMKPVKRVWSPPLKLKSKLSKYSKLGHSTGAEIIKPV
jgi:hypothetical protein